MKKLIILIAISLYCASVHAQNTLAGNLTVQQTIKLTGSITPSTIMADVNDYAPTGFGTASTVRLSSDNLRIVTGLAGGAAGRTVTLMNIGEFAITLATESTSSTAGNRFALGSADFTLAKGSALTLWYDGTSSRWRATSNAVVDGAAVDQVARDAAAAAQVTANSKQDALANASTLAKITESAGLPLWDGGTWPGGGGGGTGTVTSVSVTTANGISGTVTNPTTTPAISLTLGAITPTSVAASGTVTGSNLSGTNTGDQMSVAGNAGTATALQTARTINGVSFDGTANITVPAAAGTLTGSTLASGVTASSLTSAAGGTFGTAAFTDASAYDPAGAAAAITLSGLGGVPTTRTVNGHALSSNVTVSASDVGLSNVENTALSTWAGSSNLTTLGTVTTGTWNGTPIGDSYLSSASAWNAKVSFPGFGTTAGTAAEGNDARLSDARTPLAHTQAWSTITSTPTTLSGYGITDAQPLDTDLTALAGLSTSGILARTGAGTAATRTITGTANQVIVTNGDGVSGNPTLALPQSIATTSEVQFGRIQSGSLESSPATYGGQIRAYSGVNTSLESVGGIELPVATDGYGVKIQALSAAGSVLAFANRNGVATWTERMRLAANGNVGIGTTTPSGILDVAKPSSGGRFQVVNEGADVYNAIASRNAADSAYLPLAVRTTWLVVGSPSAGVIQQIQAPGETRMFVTNATDSISCQVGASPSATYVGSYTSHPLELRTADTPRVTIGTSGGVRFNNYGAGTLVTDSSGNVTASSDRRLKNVGAKFTRGLDDVLKIQPRFYTWKPESGMNPDDVNVGFIAQDVQDAIPEAVGTTKTNDMEEDDVVTGKKVKKSKREAAEFLTLSDRPIIAALVNAVKELKAKNDELEARITKLESKK